LLAHDIQAQYESQIKSIRNDKVDASFGYYDKQTYIITDNHRQYKANKITIGNTTSAGYIGSRYTLIAGVNVDGEIRFQVEDSSIKRLQVFEMRDQGIKCLNVPVVSSSNK